MKTWKILSISGLSVLALALLTSSAYAYMGGWGMMGSGYGGGMMGGGYGYGYTPYNPAYPTQPGLTTPATPTSQYYQPVYPFQFGGGCMGTYGWNGYGYQAALYTYTGTALTITTATTIAQNYVASLYNPDLAVREIEEYSLNFYVQIYEKGTGVGAFEMLINKYTGSIYPEQGANMMWNTKYGMMRGGILSGIFGTPTASMPLTAEQAEANAQQWLNTYIPGTTAEEAEPFYGYYHVMVLSGSEGYGMLSVNGYTGQVWFHNWHGTFIQELEIS